MKLYLQTVSRLQYGSSQVADVEAREAGLLHYFLFRSQYGSLLLKGYYGVLVSSLLVGYCTRVGLQTDREPLPQGEAYRMSKVPAVSFPSSPIKFNTKTFPAKKANNSHKKASTKSQGR
jgi:hypothetical protein